MSKMPWEMSVDEAIKSGGASVPPPKESKEEAPKKRPWEMVFEEIRGFFKPTKPKVSPASPTPPPEPSRASSEPLYPTEASMKGQGILSPAEQARASAFEKSDANLAMLDEELSRKGLSKEARKILEDERKKIVKARGGK